MPALFAYKRDKSLQIVLNCDVSEIKIFVRNISKDNIFIDKIWLTKSFLNFYEIFNETKEKCGRLLNPGSVMNIRIKSQDFCNDFLSILNDSGYDLKQIASYPKFECKFDNPFIRFILFICYDIKYRCKCFQKEDFILRLSIFTSKGEKSSRWLKINFKKDCSEYFPIFETIRCENIHDVVSILSWKKTYFLFTMGVFISLMSVVSYVGGFFEQYLWLNIISLPFLSTSLYYFCLRGFKNKWTYRMFVSIFSIIFIFHLCFFINDLLSFIFFSLVVLLIIEYVCAFFSGRYSPFA